MSDATQATLASQARPQRYHLLLVLLHWLLALLICMALFMGSQSMAPMANSDPAKLEALRAHMMVGGGILVLMVLRLAVRLLTRHPAPASTGNATLDRLAPLMHWALYGLVFVMAGSGIALSVMAGLPDIVFGGVGALPESLRIYPPRLVHGLVSKLLMLAILGHVAAALYHQFFKGDHLLRRMGLGKR